MNNIDQVLARLTFDEKVSLLTGAGVMSTAQIGRLGIKSKNLLTVLMACANSTKQTVLHFKTFVW